MAFDRDRFTFLGPENAWSAPGVFSYAAPGTEAIATVAADGYLDDMKKNVRPGDFVFVSAVGGSSENAGLYIVKGNNTQVASSITVTISSS